LLWNSTVTTYDPVFSISDVILMSCSNRTVGDGVLCGALAGAVSEES
jgi:hypothetical protein